jgi:hypothetical protein
VSNPENGTVGLSGGTVTFSPDDDFFGTAGYDYSLSDRSGRTDTGHVTVNVAPVADPVSSSHSPGALGTVRDNSPLGSPDSVESYLNATYVNLNDAPFEDRGIIEYDLSSITGTVESATLNLNVQGVAPGFPQDFDVYLYSGDGAVTLSDFSAGTLSNTATATDFGNLPVSLDASAVNNMLSSGDWLGINLRVDPVPPGEAHALVFGPSAGGPPPTLNVDWFA